MLPLSKNHYLSKSTVYVDILLNQFPKHINVQTFSQHECIIRFYRRAFSLNPVPRNWCNNAPFSSSMGEEPEMFQSLDVSRPTYWPFTRHTATGISQAEIGFFTPSFFLYSGFFFSLEIGKEDTSAFSPPRRCLTYNHNFPGQMHTIYVIQFRKTLHCSHFELGWREKWRKIWPSCHNLSPENYFHSAEKV